MVLAFPICPSFDFWMKPMSLFRIYINCVTYLTWVLPKKYIYIYIHYKSYYYRLKFCFRLEKLAFKSKRFQVVSTMSNVSIQRYRPFNEGKKVSIFAFRFYTFESITWYVTLQFGPQLKKKSNIIFGKVGIGQLVKIIQLYQLIAITVQTKKPGKRDAHGFTMYLLLWYLGRLTVMEDFHLWADVVHLLRSIWR